VPLRFTLFKHAFASTSILFFCVVGSAAWSAELTGMAFIDQEISHHREATGVLVLDKGEEALIARAWLADNAQASIEVQYFIWSTDNIGILATESLLRAADRGVEVRVIVDDLLIDAPDKSLLALALHPNIEIRIYNPKHSVGTSFIKRVMNIFTDFRGVNQRMHDKTFIVDGKVAIIGGRNMADEYFDYDHKYNYRDRDALVVGKVVRAIQGSFRRFWKSDLSVPLEQRFDGLGLLNKHVSVEDSDVLAVYRWLHQYAQSAENFEPEVRRAIIDITRTFKDLAKNIIWTDVTFVSDIPGKNKNRLALDGGGLATTSLARLIRQAREKIVIQSPYLVMSDEALALFQDALNRGVSIYISTNSLASTDNLQAFSGYKNQRQKLIDMGLQIYEYRPYPEVQQQLLERYPELKDKQPVFAIHAKSLVIDSRTVFIGTYNLDPRSQNLNTEIGIIVNNSDLANFVQGKILIDTRPENSWLASDDPDKHASMSKRVKVRFWQFMPIKPLL
jgi:putative cardiolipin synthase